MDTALRLLRNGRLIVGFPVLLATVVVGTSLVLPREYTTSGAFAPQSGSSSLARFAGVAAQLGVALPAQQANESAEFYADLLLSRHVLSQLVRSRYSIGLETDTSSGTLVELYRIRGDDSARREDKAIRQLKEAIDVTVTSKTGVVKFSITSRNRFLSEGIAMRALGMLNQFNVERRQSRAGAERRFVEARLGEAQVQLRTAEDRLQSWLQQNRDYKDSPRLTFAYQRQLNEVTLKDGVVATLAQAVEQARIDEVRDTPVLTVVDEPTVPSRPDGRRLLAKAALCLALGGLAAVLFVAIGDATAASSRQRPEAVAEIRRLGKELFRRARS